MTFIHRRSAAIVNRVRTSTPFILGLLLAAGAPRGAAAQAPPAAPAADHVAGASSGVDRLFDVSLGYSVLRDSSSSQTMPKSWVAGASYWMTPRVAIVGEASGARKDYRQDGFDRRQRIQMFLAGVRLHANARNRVLPFAQALVGSGCYCGSTRPPGDEFSTGVVVQLGGGTDVAVLDGLKLRVQGDVRRVYDGDVSFNQARFGIGAVVGFVARRRH